MLKLVLSVPALLLLSLAPSPTPSAIPQDASGTSAQAKPSPETLARAKKMYAVDCAMCHGANGNGKGELVDDMKLSLKDYTDAASLQALTDQQIYDIIKTGKGQMPGEGDRLKTPDLWGMVYVVHSFAKK